MKLNSLIEMLKKYQTEGSDHDIWFHDLHDMSFIYEVKEIVANETDVPGTFCLIAKIESLDDDLDDFISQD